MFKVSCSTYNQILSKYAGKCVLGLALSFPRVQRSFASGEDRAADITDALQLHNSLYISLSLVLPPSFSPPLPPSSSSCLLFFVLVDKGELGQALCSLAVCFYSPSTLTHWKLFSFLFFVSCPAKYLLAGKKGNWAALYCLTWFYNYSGFFFFIPQLCQSR